MIELNYKSFGEGDPVIILHGLFGMLDNWQRFGKKLAEHYTVFMVDFRNHGRSPHSDEFNYPLLAEDVRNFLESQWIYNATIIGHSMGAKVAMQLALTHPELISSLIAVDMSPRAYPPQHNQVLMALKSVPIHDVQSRNEAEKYIRENLSEESIVQFLLKNLTRQKGGGYRWKMNLDALINNYPNILEAIYAETIYDGPSLFLGGAKSDYIEEIDHEIIMDLFPHAQIEMIENAGHWVHVDAFEVLFNRVLKFIGEHLTP